MHIMLDILFYLLRLLLLYNIHLMLTHNLSVPHFIDMFMLHLPLILHMLYNLIELLYLYMIMLDMTLSFLTHSNFLLDMLFVM